MHNFWGFAACVATSCVVPQLTLTSDDDAQSTGGGAGMQNEGDGGSKEPGPASGGKVDNPTSKTGGVNGSDASGGLGGAPDKAESGGTTGECLASTGCGTGGEMPVEGECMDDERRCDEDGVPQACSALGQWVDQAACPDEQPLCEEGECVACVPDSVGCQGNAPGKCAQDGSGWEVEAECAGETPACLDATGSCGLCAKDATRCDSSGTAVLTCDSDGSWGSPEACSSGSPVCVDGKCQECDPNQGTGRTCKGNVPHLCVEGKWVSQGSCTGDTSTCVSATGRCGCSEGKRCLDGNTPQECSPTGQWVTLADCSEDAPVCQPASGECGCVENETRCAGGAKRERCIGGVWTSISNCSGSTPVCDGSGTCVQCKDSQANRCSLDQSTIEQCTQNEWVPKQDCTGSLGGICDAGACTSTAVSPAWLSCGDSFCSVGEEVCCSNDPGTPFCAQSANDCPQQQCTESTWDEVHIGCDGPSDCPTGQVCCISTQLDDNCGVWPAAINRVSTHCADDCLGTNWGSYYEEFEVCTGPAGCSVGGILPCELGVFGQEQMYFCDVYSWTEF